MNTTVIVVRHGETEWNKQGIQQGHLNSDLTELGIAQAQAAGEVLKAFPIDRMYASDLGRAVQTAQIISEAIGMPFQTDKRLRERMLGVVEGKSKQDLSEKYPLESARLTQYDPDYRVPGGESIRERYARHISCLEKLAVVHRGQTLLVVAHGGVLSSCIHKALKIPLDRPRSFSMHNGSINVFTIDGYGEWLLERWGQTGRLQGFG